MRAPATIPLLETHRRELVEICQRHGVERLDVFGSAARGGFTPGVSDVDFLVSFSQPGENGYADRYLDLAEALEAVLGCPVDLLTERSLRNPVLRGAIEQDRITVYAA